MTLCLSRGVGRFDMRQQGRIELVKQTQQFLNLCFAEAAQQLVELVDDQRPEEFNGLAPPARELQFLLAAIEIPPPPLQQPLLRELIDDAGRSAAVVAVVRAN